MSSRFCHIAIDSQTRKSFCDCENKLDFKIFETKLKFSFKFKCLVELTFYFFSWFTFGSPPPPLLFHQVGREEAWLVSFNFISIHFVFIPSNLAQSCDVLRSEYSRETLKYKNIFMKTSPLILNFSSQ